MIALLITAMASMALFYKNNQLEAERLIIKIPFISDLIFYREYYHAFSGLANLLTAGILLQNAIPITIKQTKILTVKNELIEANKLIEKGEHKRFADAFKNITAVERTMLETAEKDTDIQEQLQITGERFYELWIEKMEMLSPVVTTIVKGIVIGFIVLLFCAIFLPQYDKMSHIK